MGPTVVERHGYRSYGARVGGSATTYSTTVYRRVVFSLKSGLFGLSAEFGASPTNKIKFNPTKKNWEQKLARKIYSIANAENSRYLE